MASAASDKQQQLLDTLLATVRGDVCCSSPLRLPTQLAQLHARIVELQRCKAVADAQVMGLETMLLRVNRSTCDVSISAFMTIFPLISLSFRFHFAFIAPLRSPPCCLRITFVRQEMTSHNCRVVALQQQQQQANAAVTSAIAIVRELGEKSREKDDVIAALRMELEEGIAQDGGTRGAQAAPLQQQELGAYGDSVLAGNGDSVLAGKDVVSAASEHASVSIDEVSAASEHASASIDDRVDD